MSTPSKIFDPAYQVRSSLNPDLIVFKVGLYTDRDLYVVRSNAYHQLEFIKIESEAYNKVYKVQLYY